MYVHSLDEKAVEWRLDLVDFRVEGLSRVKVLAALRQVFGQAVGERRPCGVVKELPGSLAFKVGDGCVWVHASGPVASSGWLRGLFASLPSDDWSVRRCDWCCDVVASDRVVSALRSVCTSYVCDNKGGLTMYWGKVSRSNRRFSRCYLWREPKGGDVFLRVEHCVRPVGVAEVGVVTDAYLRGVMLASFVGVHGRRAEAVLRDAGVQVPERSCVGEFAVVGEVVRCRAILFHLKRVKRELECLGGVSGVGAVMWYVNQLIEVYNNQVQEVVS